MVDKIEGTDTVVMNVLSLKSRKDIVVRTFAIGTIALALLAAACAAPTSVDAESIQEAESPVSTSPVTTSPVVSSPATTSPATTSPVATSPPKKFDVAPSDESVAPSGNQENESEPAEQETTVTTQPPKETSETPPATEAVESHPSEPVAASIADLATRFGFDASKVTLVSEEAVTWPDSSLGCPEPGMGYTQALVNGSLIVLEVDGLRYEYHSGGGGEPFYCAFPTPPTTGDHGDT